ncbi:hypothetical protein EXS62_00810 [Candidatus Kaiserbacteria bacterium]|nr:hypothetical protein [Candidatus Kaiserbacteria bacterium]
MTKSLAAQTAQVVYELRQKNIWDQRELNRAVQLISCQGTVAEAVLAFLIIPADYVHAEARMTLLWRVLLRPTSEVLSPWCRSKFWGAELLPAEYTAIVKYFHNCPEMAEELLGPNKRNRPRYLRVVAESVLQ